MHPIVNKIENTAWQELLHRLMSASDKETATPIIDEITDLTGRGVKPPYDNLSLRDGAQLIELAMTVPMPEHIYSFRHVDHELLFMFVDLKHPTVAMVVYRHYSNCKEHLRSTALTVLAAQGTDDGYKWLGSLLQQQDVGQLMPRFYTEVSRHVELVPKLLPGLWALADKQIGELMNVLNLGIDKGHIDRTVFESVEERARSRFHELSTKVLKGQEQKLDLIQDEEFAEDVHHLGPWIDVLGYLRYDKALEQTFAKFEINYLRCCILASTIRWKRSPSDNLIQAIANDPIERGELFKILKGTGLSERFPKRYLNFESFAAIDMARWIQRDCGQNPEEVTLHSTHVAEETGTSARMCIWRFVMDGTAFAGVSGTYSREDVEKLEPIHGSDTFSNFTEWDEQSPEEHAQDVLEVLAEWRVDWAQRE